MNKISIGRINEKSPYYAAIIVQRTNASLQSILDEFDETAQALEK